MSLHRQTRWRFPRGLAASLLPSILVALFRTAAGFGSQPGLNLPFTSSNPWNWKTEKLDIPIPWQETYNLSAPVFMSGVPNAANSLYYSCSVDSLHVQSETANDLYFAKYGDGGTVSLFDQQLFPNQGVCMLRTYSHPIDLTETTRIELNVKTSGQGAPCVNETVAGRSACAPWFAVWLFPMFYDPTIDYNHTWPAEINLLENHAGSPFSGSGGPYGFVYNNVHSSFPGCDNVGESDDPSTDKIPKQFCQKLEWGVDATNINHHITVKVVVDGSGGRVLKIWHCRNEPRGSPVRTCNGSVSAQMSLQGRRGPSKFWSPVWDPDAAGKFYGKYQLVTNMWDTRGSGLEFSTSDVELSFEYELGI